MRISQLFAFLLTVSLVAMPHRAIAQTSDQLFQQGNAAQAAGNFAAAESIWRRVLELNPSNATAYNNLGVTLADQGKFEEAIAAYRQAIELDPDSTIAYNNLVIAYNNLATSLFEQGKFEEAIAAYRQAIELDPDSTTAYNNLAIAYNNLGVALADQGKFEEAIAAYRQAIELDPNLPQPQNNLKEAQRALALQRNSQPIVIDEQQYHSSRYSLLMDRIAGEIVGAIVGGIERREIERGIERGEIIIEQQYLPSETDEPLVKALRSTVRVIVQEAGKDVGIGAGWVVKREENTVWIITNRHVVSDKEDRPSSTIAVEFFSELPAEQRPRYTATIVQITPPDEEPDLAVLQVTGIPSDIQPLEMQLGRISRNTPVRVIGHPYTLDDPWHSSSGEIGNYNPDNPIIPVDAYVAEGNSGGPVINAQMQVIGIMVRIRGPRDIAVDSRQPTTIDVDNSEPATGEVGLAYHIDVVMEKLRAWRILD